MPVENEHEHDGHVDHQQGDEREYERELEAVDLQRFCVCVITPFLASMIGLTTRRLSTGGLTPSDDSRIR